MILISLSLAFILDFLFKEPRKWHPLVGFGQWAHWIEQRLNLPNASRSRGLMAWTLAVLPPLLLLGFVMLPLHRLPLLEALISGLILYFCVGWQSLLDHAKQIATPLIQGDLASARQAVSYIVSRDAEPLDASQIAAAATESVLENGADAIFSALFWFMLLGPIGALLYRLSNTLDAMWGYRTQRYEHFGWAAARIDDGLNFLPARLTAFSYALTGQFKSALQAWLTQAPQWKSPNAGPVMAAGAGALNTRLGGGAFYHGQWQARPCLGIEPAQPPSVQTLMDACSLVNRALILWLALCFLLGGLLW